jgi:hypothetical protein
MCSQASEALDNLATYLSPLVLVAALALGWRHARGTVHGNELWADTFLCVLWIAACSFLLYFPRMDYAHLAGAMPLLYAVGVGLLWRVWEGVRSGLGDRGPRYLKVAVNVSCVLLTAFVVATKSAVKVHSRVTVARTEAGVQLIPTPVEWLRLDRATLYFPIYEEPMRSEVAMFRELLQVVYDTTREGEPIFTFPSLAMVYFLTGRDNPTRQDYFLGSNVDSDGRLEVIRTLEERQVRTVVVSNKRLGGFLAVSPDVISQIFTYLRPRYPVLRRIGKYDVGRRADSPPLPEACQVRPNETTDICAQ